MKDHKVFGFSSYVIVSMFPKKLFLTYSDIFLHVDYKFVMHFWWLTVVFY